MPPSVYDNLIKEVRRQLPTLHRYYELRRRKMKLSKIHHYDTYVPILSDLSTKRTWNQAVKTVVQIAELRWADGYTSVLESDGSVDAGAIVIRTEANKAAPSAVALIRPIRTFS